MRLTLRSLLVSVLGLALGGASSAAAVSAVERNGGGVAPGGPLLGAPLVAPSVDQLLGGQGSRAAREARRSSPVAVAERQAARSKYEGLTPARSASAARAAFPDLIEQPAGGAPRLPTGQRIVRYPTDHAAQVSLPGGQGVIESLAPIASKTRQGRHVPFDLRMREAGGRFEPVRSDVGVDAPKDLSEGVALPAVGVSLTPVDAQGSPLSASAGMLAGSAVLWSTSQNGAGGVHDLSTLAKALPDGFDLTTLLFSRRSPGELYFRVGMPSGAHLRRAENGSARITRRGATLAVVSPVSATDAEGSSVPVSMRVDGDVLRLTVASSGDYLYPIAVDPEVNDPQLAQTTSGKRSNWEFFTSNSSRFAGNAVYESAGKEHLETKGTAEYSPAEWAYWGYQTKGVSHIYEIKTETSAKNKLAKIESFLEFLEPGGARETKKMLSNEFESPEYENKAATLCAANASKVEECLPASGKAKNSIHFQQSATGSPGSNYKFSDTMSQGIVSIAEPTGTHSTTSYNTTTSEFEFEVEVEGKKEKIKRKNALFGSSTWLTKYGGALELIAKDTGIGVSKTKLEYESSPGSWIQLAEHNYLEVENACKGVQCYETHSEFTTLPTLLPDGEQKIRYKAEEAMSGTQSLSTEGQATVKVDTAAPHGVHLEGLPFGDELSERPYELTGVATDGEGSTVVSSGIKSIALFIDGSEFGTAGGACTAEKGACTGSTKWTVNGAELGAGHHAIVVVAIDKAGNEKRLELTLSIRHSTPVPIGPGSVDLQSGDFALGAGDVSLGSGLTVGRTSTSRAVEAGLEGPLGPQWRLSLGTSESLTELVDGSVLLTDANGRQSIFASLGAGKFESPVGDSNLKLTLEEDAEKHKLAYYLENPAAHTKDKFTLPGGGTKVWVPTRQEGAVATDTLSYTYQTVDQHTDYPLPTGSHPNGITTGPDGNLWFVNTGVKTVGKMTPAGAVSEYELVGGNELTGITLGPDNKLWATESGANRIQRFGTSGRVDNQGFLPAGSHPTAIVSGPDGNVWFTNTGTNKIGKITTGMVVTEYAAGSPRGIAAGSDGNMWFTNYSENKIGKMTTAGVVTQYALPAGSLPLNIVTGSDHNLWFTESGTNKIGKITTAGVVTEYALPAGSTPVAVTAGPDKNLWFTENGTSKIGKITTGGTVTEYGTTSGSEAYGITTGPDGNMWFTKYGANKIGTMTTTGKVTEPSEVLAPVPAGVSCSPMKAGCRSLKFEYASTTSATGENQSEWGAYQSRLAKVLLDAYNPATKAMQETAVAEYSYDNLGRLRAEWDPRISPALKTVYGYDSEGHLTALTPPGQESWVFTYGAIEGDKGTGRLLKVDRAPASEPLWNGEVLKNTAAPIPAGSHVVGVRMSAWSTGTWTGGPVSYSYQWESCEDNASNGCFVIPGTNNPNFTPTNKELKRWLVLLVTATNGGGSVTKASLPTGPVEPRQFNEYALPSGSKPYGVVAGFDEKAWFTEAGTRKVGTTPITGEPLTEYSVGASGEPQAITSGPDHNLWFTKSSTEIGRLTTAGALTTFTLPANTYTSSGITTGPDGNIWFTEAGPEVNKVAKMNTSGTVLAQYAAGSGPPNGIVSGPDGNLWVAQSAVGSNPGNSIAKYTPGTGVKISYALPVNSHPYGITVGADGNLWFTETGTDKVGKITTSGTITEYALPAGSEPRGLTSYETVSIKKLWVAERGTSKLAEISTEGVIKEVALPVGSQPESVSIGPPDSCQNQKPCFWVTEPGTNKVLRFNPGVKETSLVEGELKAPAPGAAIEYGVPLSGGSGLQNMTSGEVAKWGQKDVPVEATAIVPPDEAQGWPASSYKRATAYYLDEHGREVNVGKPSTATYGSIATTEYNEFNDAIRLLSPDNRATALAAGASSAEVSKLLDVQNTYNGEGKKESEVSEAGTRLIDTLGPQHEIKYVAGKEQKKSLARDHKQFVYDQGAPEGETYDLVTETFELAQLVNHEEVEVRTTKKSYSGQSNVGWKLRTPTSVTVDPEGLKLTTTTEYDATTGQIKETRGAGAEKTFTFSTKFGEVGTEPGKLKAPWGVAVNSEGKLWVVDRANNRVEQFSAEGTYVKKFGEAGSEPGKLSEPEGIAIDASGHIWVADTGNNRVQEFTSEGVYMAQVGSLGSEPGKFKSPAAIAFDSGGNMWVADTGNNRVEQFDKEAKYVSEFGSLGSGNGQLKEPQGIGIDSVGLVWVVDTGNNRVQAFTKAGAYSTQRGSTGAGSGQFNSPRGIGFDSSGNAWIVDAGNNRVQQLSKLGAYVTQIGWSGAESGQLNGPRAAAVDATGKLWVTDSTNNRVESWSKGLNAHDKKIVYYSAAANTEGYAACGEHPEWAGLVCETLPAKQPELAGLPKAPVTTLTYNLWNEPETTTETFGSTTRTKTVTYDAAGREATSETTASTGTALPKVTFAYNTATGELEKQTTSGEVKVLSSEYNRLGQLVKYSDSDGNSSNYKYAGPENDYLLEEFSDSSNGGSSSQTYSYDTTTKMRTKLVDSAAGTFTAAYDAEGALMSVVYPNNMCANYTRDAAGETTAVKYIKTSNCAESEPAVWYSDARSSSIRGEMLSQSSTLASETYTYDAAGRLTEAQETPAGEGCTTRAYAYEAESNRTSVTSRAPGGGGACATEGGTVEAHNYDEANRLADGGIAYDGLGNVTNLPAADAEGHELTSSYYVDNAVASQTQNGVTNSYSLDPEGRVRETVTGSKKVVSHYDGAGETVAWTSESAEHWTRNIPGIDGALTAVQTNGETPILQLHDLQGNVAATLRDKTGETSLLSTYNSTEFGVPNAGKAPPKFAWLGAAGVESSLTSGVITYGSTSYVPQTGRALQSQQVEPPGLPGGSGSGAAYTAQEEPWNMQGAARAGAEAPGLEAARELAAAEAALRAAIAAGGDDPVIYMFQKDAIRVGEVLNGVDSWAKVWEAVFTVLGLGDPVGALEAAVVGVISLSVMEDWLHDAGSKLESCGKNTENWVSLCRLKYESLLGGKFINPYSDPEVDKCGTYEWTWNKGKLDPGEGWECRALKQSPVPLY